MKTLIIDTNNLIHRTFWTAKKQHERAQSESNQLGNFHIYFTLNAIFSYVNLFKPTKVLCVWDEKPDYQQNDRKSQFANYKGNRSKDITPHQNNEVIKSMLYSLGVRSIFPRQLEADDVIAFLTNRLEGQKIVVSVDKDFIQLISKDTVLYDPIRKEEYNLANFEEKTGWTDTTTWLNAKCLLGDKSDNVPGVPGFGKVRVKKFINEEIALTEDEQEIYLRNRSLFNLSAFFDLPEEEEYYNKQLQSEISANWKAFVEECEFRDFNSILKKKEKWYSAFIMKNKLESLFS